MPGRHATLKLYCDYELYYSGSFTGIQGTCNDGWSLSDKGANIEISRPTSYASYKPINGGEIIVNGNVDVDYYIITKNGRIKFVTDSFRAGYVYSFDKGYTNTYFELTSTYQDKEENSTNPVQVLNIVLQFIY